LLTNLQDRITSTQTTVLVSSFILGLGILTLPRAVTDETGTPDGWISVILGGLVAMLAGSLLAKFSQCFPGKTFYQYSQDIAGKWIGNIICLYGVGYFTLLASFEVRAMAEVTDFFLLPATPKEVTMGMLLLASAYLVVGGLNAVARLYEGFLPITVILFFLVLFMGFKEFDVDHLRPVLSKGWLPVLQGVKTTSLSYLGLETMLFLPAFMDKPRDSVKAVVVGIGISMFFYVLTVIIVIGVLTVDDVVTLTFPTIDLARSVELEGVFFERYESFLLAVWILQIFTTLSLCHYFAGLGLRHVFANENWFRPFVYGLLPVIYGLGWVPTTINDVFAVGDLLGYLLLGLIVVIPLLLLIIAKMRGMLRANHS
jgi:spore germination protein